MTQAITLADDDTPVGGATVTWNALDGLVTLLARAEARRLSDAGAAANDPRAPRREVVR